MSREPCYSPPSWPRVGMAWRRRSIRRPSPRCLGLCGLLACAAVGPPATATASAGAMPTDPPRIIPWHQIGDVGIGMLKSRVTSEYGPGTNTPGAPELWDYRVRGGKLTVSYSRGRVRSVSTNSQRYRTPNGFGIGSHIPLRACQSIANRCEILWHGFQLDGHELDWVKFVTWNGHKFLAIIYVSSDYTLVTSIQLGLD